MTLECVADHRILTVPQLAAIFRKNKQVIRRRFGDLAKEGFIEVIKRDFGRARGRPENLLGLTERGVDVLREKNLIGKDVSYENVGPVSNRLIDHQLLLNWFRIHLNEIDKVEPRPTLKFFAYNSPFVPREPEGCIITTDYSPIGRRTVREVKFTPDAVFIMTNAAQDKSLLFFLEVDCGTETLSSPQRDMSDIRQKILNYQWYFQSLKYKRYEKIFEVTFSQDRSLAYIPLKVPNRKLEPVWVTKDGNTSSLGMTKRNYHSVSVSPNGAYAAFRVPPRKEDEGDLWIYDLERRTETRLARDVSMSTPVWTPDSNEVIYMTYNPWALFRQKFDGTKEPKLIAQFERMTSARSCSPDGKVLLADRDNDYLPMMGWDIWTVLLDEGSTATAGPLIERYNEQQHGTWSPDGQWMAYVSNESGGVEVYVEPYPGLGPKTKISIGVVSSQSGRGTAKSCSIAVAEKRWSQQR